MVDRARRGPARSSASTRALSGLPAAALPAYHGTATRGRTTPSAETRAFVVELPGGRLPRRRAPSRRRRARARPARCAPPRVVEAADPVRRRSARRRCAAYAQRHYGIDDYRLRHPQRDRRALHRHRQLPPAYEHVRPDVPDSELHELPGVCTHYVVDRDGTIYQLVHDDHVPPHGRPQLHGDRHRARRPQRRSGARRPAPDGGVAAPDPLAAGPLRHPRAQRDRPQREPVEPVTTASGWPPAQPDPRRLPQTSHGRLSASAWRGCPAPASLR